MLFQDSSSPYRRSQTGRAKPPSARRPGFADTEPMGEIPSPIPIFSLAGGLSPLLLVPMTIPVLVALFAPPDVLDLWPSARQYTDWMQSLLPHVRITGHADSTSYPQVALLAHSLTLIALLLMSLVWLGQSIVNYPHLRRRNLALGGIKITRHLVASLAGPAAVTFRIPRAYFHGNPLAPDGGGGFRAVYIPISLPEMTPWGPIDIPPIYDQWTSWPCARSGRAAWSLESTGTRTRRMNLARLIGDCSTSSQPTLLTARSAV